MLLMECSLTLTNCFARITLRSHLLRILHGFQLNLNSRIGHNFLLKVIDTLSRSFTLNSSFLRSYFYTFCFNKNSCKPRQCVASEVGYTFDYLLSLLILQFRCKTCKGSKKFLFFCCCLAF